MQGEKAGNAYLTSIRRYQKLWEQIGNKMGTRWEQYLYFYELMYKH